MPDRIAACHICCDASVMRTTLMPGDWMSRRAARVSTASGEAPRADHQDVGQLAVEQLLEQARGVGGQPARRQDVDVAVGGLLDPQDEVLIGCGEHDAAHAKAFP